MFAKYWQTGEHMLGIAKSKYAIYGRIPGFMLAIQYIHY
jgi:hypothetical protein